MPTGALSGSLGAALLIRKPIGSQASSRSPVHHSRAGELVSASCEVDHVRVAVSGAVPAPSRKTTGRSCPVEGARFAAVPRLPLGGPRPASSGGRRGVRPTPTRIQLPALGTSRRCRPPAAARRATGQQAPPALPGRSPQVSTPAHRRTPLPRNCRVQLGSSGRDGMTTPRRRSSSLRKLRTNRPVEELLDFGAAALWSRVRLYVSVEECDPLLETDRNGADEVCGVVGIMALAGRTSERLRTPKAAAPSSVGRNLASARASLSGSFGSARSSGGSTASTLLKNMFQSGGGSTGRDESVWASSCRQRTCAAMSARGVHPLLIPRIRRAIERPEQGLDGFAPFVERGRRNVESSLLAPLRLPKGIVGGNLGHRSRNTGPPPTAVAQDQLHLVERGRVIPVAGRVHEDAASARDRPTGANRPAQADRSPPDRAMAPRDPSQDRGTASSARSVRNSSISSLYRSPKSIVFRSSDP